MKALSIVGVVVAALGILFGLTAWGSTTANLDEMVGYGFISFLISGYFLAMSIVALRRK